MDGEEKESLLGVFEREVHLRGGVNNPVKIQKPSMLLKILDVQGSGACQDNLSKLAPSNMKDRPVWVLEAANL